MNEPISIKEHNEGRSGIVIGITDKIINNIAVEFYKYTSGHNFHGYDFKILKPHGWFFMEKELDFLYNWIEL